MQCNAGRHLPGNVQGSSRPNIAFHLRNLKENPHSRVSTPMLLRPRAGPSIVRQSAGHVPGLEKRIRVPRLETPGALPATSSSGPCVQQISVGVAMRHLVSNVQRHQNSRCVRTSIGIDFPAILCTSCGIISTSFNASSCISSPNCSKHAITP